MLMPTAHRKVLLCCIILNNSTAQLITCKQTDEVQDVVLSTIVSPTCPPNTKISVYYPYGVKCKPSSFGTCVTAPMIDECKVQCLGSRVFKFHKLKMEIVNPFDDISDSSNKLLLPIDSIQNFTAIQGIKDLDISQRDLLASPRKLSFPKGFFKHFTSVEVTGIDMSTQLKTPGMLPQRLSTLKLDKCNLKSYPVDLENLLVTKKIVLSRNYLAKFPSNGTLLYKSLMSKKDQLDLSRNFIRDFNFTGGSVAAIDLRHNQLFRVPHNVSSLSNLTSLKLQGNLNLLPLIAAPEFDFMQRQNIRMELESTPKNASECIEESVLKNDICVSPTYMVLKEADFRIDGTSDSSNGTLILWISLIAASCVSLLVLLLLFRSNKKSKLMRLQRERDEAQYAALNTERDEILDHLDNDEELNELRLPVEDVIKAKCITQGAFGQVWIGTYNRNEVAVKELLCYRITTATTQDFIEEIKRMHRLQHPNIVHFYGASWSSGSNLCMITEFMDCGDLRHLLNSEVPLRWKEEKLAMAVDVIKGLTYLHGLSPAVMHRDLKSRNVLIDSQMGCKLTDFGLSRDMSFDETLTVGVGTVRWTAPEVLMGEHYDELSDIYSFGVILSELDTREIPYAAEEALAGHALPEVSIAHHVVVGRVRPQFSNNIPSELLHLGRMCLQTDTRLRPSAAQVLEILTGRVTDQIMAEQD